MRSSVKVTVAIPTYNGEKYLADLLEKVFAQEVPFNFEVLVIDSGSNDNSLEIIGNFPNARLHQIPNSEFGHGKTRNLAAEMANGEFVVYLSQDAVPAHAKWLEYMVEPFYLSDKIFCVVGKQAPRPFSDATTKREVSTAFAPLGPDHSLMIHRGKSLVSSEAFNQPLTFFSDVNSAVRKDYLLNKIPYRDVDYSEDQLLGKEVLEKGYLKAYAPQGLVMHSNEYPLSEYFFRRFDEYSAMKRVVGVSPEGRPLSLLKLFILESLRDISFTIKDKDYTLTDKLYNLLTSPVRNFQRLRASYIVARNHGNHREHEYSLEKRSKNKSA
jgi:rhamnosyltransferase